MTHLRQHPMLGALKDLAELPSITTGGFRFTPRSALMALAVAAQLPMRGAVNEYEFNNLWTTFYKPDVIKMLKDLGQVKYVNEPEVTELVRKLMAVRTGYSALYNVLHYAPYQTVDIPNKIWEQAVTLFIDNKVLMSRDEYVTACETKTLTVAMEERFNTLGKSLTPPADMRKEAYHTWVAQLKGVMGVWLEYFHLLENLTPIKSIRQTWLTALLTEAWGDEALAKRLSGICKQHFKTATRESGQCVGPRVLGFGL